MGLIARFFLFIIGTTTLLASCSDRASAQTLEPLSLSHVVLWGTPTVNELKQSIGEGDKGGCIARYLEAIPSDSPLWHMNPSPEQETILSHRKNNMVEQMVTVMGNHVRNEARAFVSLVPFHLEWEGTSEAPLAEVSFIDEWLARYPHTSIAPFLYLLKAHRLRAGFEAASAQKETALQLTLSQQYRKSINTVLSLNNPLITCIASDLDAQPYIYIKDKGRP